MYIQNPSKADGFYYYICIMQLKKINNTYVILAHIELISKRLQELEINQTGEINEIILIPDNIIFFLPDKHE